jgi:hypothetical protein
MGSSGDILVGSVEPPALNRRLADPPPSRALNSTAPVFLEQEAGRTPAHPGRRDARSVCPGYARLRRACQRGCASSAQAGGTPAHPGRRDARSVCPGYARLRRACQRGCASSAQAGSDARASSRLTQAQRPRPARFTQARCPQRLPWVRAPPARMPARMRLQCAGGQ